jgi:hypothetical protein
MRCELLAVLALAACEAAPVDPDDASYAPPVQAPDCRPNDDGTIDAAELPFVPGAAARVRIGVGPLPVDVVARTIDGEATWDFSRPDPDDQPLGLLRLSVLDEQWFADDFADGEYAGPLVPGGALLGPLVVDDDGVKLLGMASADPDPPEGTTLAVYDEPAVLYPFPLAEGARAISEVRASNAELLGLPTAFDDRYDVEVTGRGTMILPDLVLANTLRVTVRLERTLLAGDLRQVTHVFVHECLGEVARVVSEAKPRSEEIPDDFDVAVEVRRLSL